MSTIEQVLTATVTAEQNLDLPPEIKSKLIPGEQYTVIVQEDTLTFAKSPRLTWDIVRAKHEALEEELTDEIMEEICELVREVRRDQKTQSRA
ncbi:hypothetical protein IQ218_04790 [Synechocystis salina LEGE 06099]|nr:hypothetical protein [Synechocystis salina LEGE 06099]